jgi:hypothetical protein
LDGAVLTGDRTTQTDELNEARELLDALEGCELTAGDKRFFDSWRSYLARSGDDAAIGRWRLQQLRKVAQSYGIGQADEPEPTQVMDFLI